MTVEILGEANASRARRGALAGVAVALVAGAIAAPTAGAQGTGSPELLARNAQVVGRSYTEWDVEWGKRSTTRLRSTRALVTTGPNRCGVQIGNARLLPASIEGRITARCTIPPGTFLVFPVTGYVAGGEQRDALAAEVRQGFRAIERAELTVDGQKLRKPGQLVTTPAYRVTLRRGNPLDVPPGRLWLQSRDYFAILSPPGPGRHVIETLGVVRPPGERRFELGMTYRLTVAAAS